MLHSAKQLYEIGPRTSVWYFYPSECGASNIVTIFTHGKELWQTLNFYFINLGLVHLPMHRRWYHFWHLSHCTQLMSSPVGCRQCLAEHCSSSSSPSTLTNISPDSGLFNLSSSFTTSRKKKKEKKPPRGKHLITYFHQRNIFLESVEFHGVKFWETSCQMFS